MSGARIHQGIELKVEIRDFLDALDAYPAHFARDPSLSFEAYFVRAKKRVSTRNPEVPRQEPRRFAELTY
jgi:hypothetical protein